VSAKRGPREGLLLPILIPLAALAVIGLALFGFSRVLLRVSATAATVTALIAAAGIMVVASLVVSRKEVGSSSLLSLVGGVVGIAMLAGGGALLLGQPEGPGAEPTVVTLAAPVNAAADGFTQTELSAPAGQPFVIRLTSEDTVVHNVDVAPEAGQEPFATGPDVLGPGGSGDLTVDPLDPGTYVYFCKYHPATMKGTLTVKEGAPSPPAGGPVIDVRAEAVAFDPDEIDLPADTATTIHFENADAGTTHNIAIYTDDTAATAVWDGPDLIGPGSVDYDVPPIGAGEYFFRCDTHPTMFGTVVVAPAGGGAGSSDGGGGSSSSPPPSPSG